MKRRRRSALVRLLRWGSHAQRHHHRQKRCSGETALQRDMRVVG
jgi:hypothetical protein